jgi:ligand-binding SRPBCC domain-containing protein
MNHRAVRFAIRSSLRAPAEEVWRAITSPERIADELRPWLHMTFPAHIAELTPATVPLGRRLCRSWILLFGVLPVEYDDVTLVEFDDGRRFLERSSMASMRLWEHERVVEPGAEGCQILDRLHAVPRRGVPAVLVRTVVTALFEHRHARLRQRYGGERLA